MRPRITARPALAGVLCLAFTGAGASQALAQSDTAPSTPTPSAQAAQEPRIAVAKRRLEVKAGSRTRVVGRVRPAAKGLVVSLQVKRDGRWKRMDRDRTGTTGRYVLRERVARTGSAPVRIRVSPAPGVRAGTRRVGRLHVFRWASASWYGPGFYGNRTGCGSILGYSTLGVAHKTLPCGTMVTFKHGGRSVRVPVIDRGPYVAGREYDLTGATARRLGFSGHGAILATR